MAAGSVVAATAAQLSKRFTLVVRHRRWLVSHNGYSLASPAGADRDHESVGFHDTRRRASRCAPGRKPVPARWAPPAPGSCSRLIRPDHHEFLFPATARYLAGFLQPLGPRRQHRPERDALRCNNYRHSFQSTAMCPASAEHRPERNERATVNRRRTTILTLIRTADPEPVAHRRRHSTPTTGRRSTGSHRCRRPGGWAHTADWTPPRRTGHDRGPSPKSLAAHRHPRRHRRHCRGSNCTACGQMSKAVTLAQPISAAAIATNPLPVHRSSTLRRGIKPVRRIVSTSR